MCSNPNGCNVNDEYWGRSGSLLCLTSGSGDIAWARLDDVRSQFGKTTSRITTSPEGYSYLCPDGSTVPVNSTSSPCVWVAKPWPVIATKRYLYKHKLLCYSSFFIVMF